LQLPASPLEVVFTVAFAVAVQPLELVTVRVYVIGLLGDAEGLAPDNPLLHAYTQPLQLETDVDSCIELPSHIVDSAGVMLTLGGVFTDTDAPADEVHVLVSLIFVFGLALVVVNDAVTE
jgi:hypothetical protein